MDAAYLMHHGIKGQKWGVENGPPYPLSFKDYSKAEKRQVQIKDNLFLLKQKYNERAASINKQWNKFHEADVLKTKMSNDKEISKDIESLRKLVDKMPREAKDFKKFITQTEKEIDNLTKALATDSIKNKDVLDAYDQYKKKEKVGTGVGFAVGTPVALVSSALAGYGALQTGFLNPLLGAYVGLGLGTAVGSFASGAIIDKADQKLQEQLDDIYHKKKK